MAFERILVATDFGDSSERALELAVGIAEQFGSELTTPVHNWEVRNDSARGLERALLGGEAENLMRMSPVPALTVYGAAT